MGLATPQGEAERAKRASTSYSFVVDEKKFVCEFKGESLKPGRSIYINDSGCGGMAEWFKAAVLKTASLKGDVGSNPTPSAMLS